MGTKMAPNFAFMANFEEKYILQWPDKPYFHLDDNFIILDRQYLKATTTSYWHQQLLPQNQTNQRNIHKIYYLLRSFNNKQPLPTLNQPIYLATYLETLTIQTLTEGAIEQRPTNFV